MSGARRLQWAILPVLLGGLLVAVLLLHGFWRRQLSHLTGAAQWVWVTDALEHIHPAAGLFVASLRLERPPSSALLKVCGDREYVVYVNGTAAACGWSRPGFRLDLYDVGHLLRQGENTVAIEVRAPTPAGGLLAALDVDGVGRNLVVTGRDFLWREAFSLAPVSAADRRPPVVWGSPPRFPWGYPAPVSYPRTLDEMVSEEAVRVADSRPLPGGGWQLEPPEPRFGYLWLELDERAAVHMTVVGGGEDRGPEWAREQAEPVVRVGGQRRWLSPEPLEVGVVYVFSRTPPVAIEVLPVREELRPVAPGAAPGRHELPQRTRWRIRNLPG